MGTRAEDLTKMATPIAEKLTNRSSLKLVLSAGVLALNELPSEKREFYLDYASGAPPNELLAKQNQRELNSIFEKAQNNPHLSSSQKKRLNDAQTLLENLLVKRLVPQQNTPSKSA